MSLRMKLIYLFVPFIRLGNFIKRAISSYISHFFTLKPSSTTFKLGSWDNDVLIQTKYGLISGFSDKGSWCWKGIPYATPPVGPFRWKAPLTPTPWIGTRKTRKFGNSAAQIMPILGPSGSEDCLYLNIWRPKTPETKLPVYLYIHGGGNSIGTSAEVTYYGNAVAEKANLLYISINFRLGAMGWFIHPTVTNSGSPEDKSGNFGTLDIIKALEWVQDNIRAFGGDPDNVTIAGESGGAFNVLSLLISTPAKGLFHRAIVESGLSYIWSNNAAEAQSDNLLVNLLIKDRKAKNREEAEQIIGKMSEREVNNYFRSKSAFKITKCIPTRDFGMADWRTIFTDGTIIPKEGYAVFSTGEWANKVPLIIGCTKDELKLFGNFRKDPPRNTRKYDLIWGYRSLLWRVSGLDSLVCQMTSNTNIPIYAYRFDWGSPDNDGVSVLPKNMGRDLGAHHAAELPFFLGMGMGALSMMIGKTHTKHNRPGREKLTDLCMSYLANFACTGNPNGESHPHWPPWDTSEKKNKILVLDADMEDLRLSYLKDIVTVQSVLDLINSELKEPELGMILSYLDDIIPFGVNKADQ
ncbi:MAG: carboxylesterase family protein [Candidatus Heimdallarchaeota archaeon]|nr:MAG: carboxylesterase family protein [Candidatus Heimdallarchaeota archaeon]